MKTLKSFLSNLTSRIKRKKSVHAVMETISSSLIRIKNLIGVETVVVDLEKENPNIKKREKMSHKKIMKKASKSLKKDAEHYAKEAKHDKGKAKKKDMIERKEAMSAAKDMDKRAKKAHE